MARAGYTETVTSSLPSHQWLPAMPGFPNRVGDANKDGHCPKEAVRAPGQEQAGTEGETEEVLRQDCDTKYQ